MDKTALKNFAIYARNKLMQDVATKANMIGITKTKIEEPISKDTEFMIFDIGFGKTYKLDKKDVIKRESLINEIKNRENDSDYKTAFNSIIEEVAYTWFNRMVAIRFMEVNDYLPNHTRVLSSGIENDDIPEIVTNVFDLDLDLTEEENDYICNLKEDGSALATNELFNFLFIKTCNDLNKILPDLFEKSNDYTELLFNNGYSDKEGVVYKLTHDISENEFNIEEKDDNEEKGQVEIFGWLYQYYNQEKKDQVINIYKGTVKKEDIPAATQLFTTDWVVKYMVDNSLGRYWIERNEDSEIIKDLEFFITSKTESMKYVDEKIDPKELTIFDPCMGSGHVLTYAFDVLMKIYVENLYSEAEAAKAIIENNLYGLDIDKRAYQIAYIAIMMKARSYNKRLFRENIKLNISYIEESNGIEKFYSEDITKDEEMNKIGEYLVKQYKDAKEIGTLLDVEEKDYDAFEDYLEQCIKENNRTLYNGEWFDKTAPKIFLLVKQAKIMSRKYTSVTTNPPYLNKLSGNLKEFINENYKLYGRDLFSAFMKRNFKYTIKNAYLGFMTPFVWMFIKTYEQLRKFIIENKSITTLVEMEYSAFEEATVPICTFVLKNGSENQKGFYFKLSEFKGGMEVQKIKVLEGINDNKWLYFYETSIKDFKNIPRMPIVYWVSEKVYKAFSCEEKLSMWAEPRIGMVTGDTDRFIRSWSEVDFCNINTSCRNNLESIESSAKWFPYQKGGDFRRWFGNNEYIINWKNDGFEIKFDNYSGKRVRSHNYNGEFGFKESLTWTGVSSSKFAFRYVPNGYLFNNSGPFCYVQRGKINVVLSLLNSKVAEYFNALLNPTVNILPGYIKAIPLNSKIDKIEVEEKALELINFSKTDWNIFESSWDFEKSPLIQDLPILNNVFKEFKENVNSRFFKVKHSEETVNKALIEIYGLESELTPEVADKDITVTRIYDNKFDIPEDMKNNKYVLTKKDVIKQFISYFVGCMFGRYSLDVEGLVYAGGEFDDSKYKTFIPDPDNSIPITDFEYFEDDIVTRFVEFVEVVYGKDSLEENLDFIAEALEGKDDSRDVIRNYFIKDFFKDHCQMYNKKPIYWLYDSGKENGFKALIYMHRYTGKTTSIVRTKYLNPLQSFYRSRFESLSVDVEVSNSAKDKKKAKTYKEKIEKQLKEMKVFDDKIAHIANEEIEIDLDDGVKINHEKVQTDRDGKVLNILAKIK